MQNFYFPQKYELYEINSFKRTAANKITLSRFKLHFNKYIFTNNQISLSCFFSFANTENNSLATINRLINETQIYAYSHFYI